MRTCLYEKQPALHWRWLRNGGTEHGPHRVCSSWLDALPTTYALTFAREEFAWSLRERLGMNIATVGLPCKATLPHGEPCSHTIDLFGRHHLVCNQGAAKKRHNQMRDLIAAFARTIGIETLIEQRNCFEAIQPDGEGCEANSYG